MIQQQRLTPPRCPREIIAEAVELHNVTRLYGCFSGGRDSLVATWFASRHPLFAGVISIDTTIAIPQTHEYIRQTCERFGWPLLMQTTPKTWEWLCATYGLLGPAYHQLAYRYLKERAFDAAKREINPDRERIGFVSGARRAESKRRAKNVQYHHRRGSTVWINPIADYWQSDRDDVVEQDGLPVGEVTKRLCMSGDCLCGTTFEHEQERRAEIRQAYPEAYARIVAGEEIAAKHGKPCQWATRPDKPMLGVAEDDPQLDLPLCWSCEAKISN